MLLILFSLSFFYQNSYKNTKKLQTILFLQQQSYQLLNSLKPHIEHISFQGLNRENSNYDLFKNQLKTVNLLENCLIFFYDLNQDGCIGKRRTKKSPCRTSLHNMTTRIAEEIFGFKLKNQEMYMLNISKKQNNCSAIQCKQILNSCDKGYWTKLTEKNNFKVTKLHFLWLKENHILKITLTLMKNKHHYTSHSYIYILNDEQTN
ncbi:hypothetical protein A6A21_02600 [Phocoenobacter uteri]|nr:hypothetical protein [Phocoenobacter uteri]